MLKVKICGLTRIEDARLALSLGAVELGFILAPSPRRIEPETIQTILEALRGDGRLPVFRAIGVFVNEKADAMRDIISFTGLDAAQVHGDETPEACASFSFPWYRALRIGTEADARLQLSAGWDCLRLLVDASSRSAYGGTGERIAPEAGLAARALARSLNKEFFIAGGLKPTNIAGVIRSLSPEGIDVSSGVEERPGVKSPEKLAALFDEIGEAYATR